MEKLYCVVCGNYRKFEKPNMSQLFLLFAVKCKNEDEKIFTE